MNEENGNSVVGNASYVESVERLTNRLGNSRYGRCYFRPNASLFPQNSNFRGDIWRRIANIVNGVPVTGREFNEKKSLKQIIHSSLTRLHAFLAHRRAFSYHPLSSPPPISMPSRTNALIVRTIWLDDRFRMIDHSHSFYP